MPKELGQLTFGFTFPKDFCNLYEEYRNDSSKLHFLEIEGISPYFMDIPLQSKLFFKNNVADMSIDANANANEVEDGKNPNIYSAEITKGQLKLEGYYLLWRELEKQYGVKRANHLLKMIWDGDEYLHDASGAMIQTYYCYAYSTQKIMAEGRPWGQLYSVAPKRADSFMAQVIETTMDFSQQQAGAIAITDLIVNYAYYSKKENLSDDAILNDLQKFIHVMNNKFRVSGQSVKWETPILVNGEFIPIGSYVDTKLSEVGFDKDAGEQSYMLDFESRDDTTLSLNIKNGEHEEKKIKGFIRHERKNPIVDIKLNTGQSISVTEDHSLFSLDDRCNIVEVKPSDNIKNVIIPINKKGTCTEVNISSYKSCLGNQNKNTKILDTIELSEDFMYFLGYYIADGSLNTSSITISCHNETIEEHFLSGKFNFLDPVRADKDTIRFNIGKQLVSWIEDTFGHYSTERRIPAYFTKYENILHLIAGYIDGDGHCDGKNIYLKTSNTDLIKDIQYLLQANGLLSTYFETISNDNNYISQVRELGNLYINNAYSKEIPLYLQKPVDDSKDLEEYSDYSPVINRYRAIIKQKVINFKNRRIRSEHIESIKQHLYDILRGVELFDIDDSSCYLDLAAALCLPTAIANKTIGANHYNFNGQYNLKTNVGVFEFKKLVIRQISDIKELLTNISNLDKTFKVIKVISSEVTDRQDNYVYDISVEDNENFLASNGIFAHNSPFCNISLFDRNNLKVLFEDYTYPDYTTIDIEYVEKIQKIFLEFFSKGDPTTGLPYRFPVVTATYLNDPENGYPLDEKFLWDLCEATYQTGATNIYVSDDVGKIASCCFSGDTEVRFYDSKSQENVNTTFREAYNKGFIEVEVYQTNTGMVPAKLIRVPYNKPFYKVSTDVGDTLYMTEDHINPTTSGDIEAKYLTDSNMLIYDLKYAGRRCNRRYRSSSYLKISNMEAIGKRISELKEIGKKITKAEISSLSLHASHVAKDPTQVVLEEKYAYCFEIQEGYKPYFTLPSGIITHNCRLINDFKLLKGGDSFGNGGQIGSARVCTLNLPSYALQAEGDKNKFMEILDNKLEEAHDILRAHRSLLHKRAEIGFIPFINRGYVDIDNQLFSTVGLNGIYEAVLFLTGKKMEENEKAKNAAKEIMTMIKERTYEWIDKEELPYNVEQVPAESLAPKNALKDKLRFGDDKQPFPLYSNQFIPLWTDIDIFDRAKMDAEFTKTLTGGGISHFNMDKPFSTPQEMFNSVMYNITVGNEHFAYNFNRQICENGHVTIGHGESKCSVCGGKKVDDYTRVIGYFVPVSSWNKTRREIEHAMRVHK